MSSADDATVATVSAVLARVLSTDVNAQNFSRETEVLGVLPGFDSHTVVALLLELEDEFSIEVNDDEVSAELFETIGALSDFVATKQLA